MLKVTEPFTQVSEVSVSQKVSDILFRKYKISSRGASIHQLKHLIMS